MIIIKNIRIYDFEKFIENSFIAFEKQIIKVGLMNNYHNYIEDCSKKNITFKEVEGNGSLLMPGLVLGHTHIYSTFAKGWLTPYNPKSFQDILNQLWWKLDRALGEEEIYYSGLTSGQAYLKQGITTVIDHHASGEMIKGSLSLLKKAVVDDIGIRGVFCFETSDRFNVSDCINENVTFYEEMKSLNSQCARGLLGLHASFSLNDESLKALAQTPEDMPLHVHVGESREDVQWTREKCGTSIIERFDRYNLLREDSLYVHGVHLIKEDFNLIKHKKGFMVFNPSSNMNNGVGLPPIDRAIELEIPWIVGNDGLGFGIARDFQTMIFSSNLKAPNHFALDFLHKSILNSYDYVSKRFGCELGRIKEGYEADFMLIPYDTITPMAINNAFGHFVYGILEQHPKDVWVKGIQRISNYKSVEDITEDLEKAKKCAQKLWRKIQ